MDNFQIEGCLKSMIVLVDTAEQQTDEYRRRCGSFAVPYQRQNLDYGDYAYNFKLPNGEWVYALGDAAIYPDVVIERKMSLQELSGNLCQNWDRFCNEFERAMQGGASVYLLVEDATWVKIVTGKYGTRFNPKAYLHRLLKLIAKYGLKPIFVNKELSGQMIYEILYRELKYKLESGFYG